MDKKKIKYFYFDMDGTLLDDNKVLSQKNILSLKKLMNSGFRVGIISGRPDYMLKKELALIKTNLPAIAINGAKIVHNDQTIKFHLLDKNVCRKITKFLTTNGITFLGYSKDVMYYFLLRGKKSKWIDWIFKIKKESSLQYKWKIEAFDKSITHFAKILVIASEINTSLLKKLKDFIIQFPSVYGISSQTGVLDIMPHNISKGTALRFLNKIKIIDLKKTIVFGDGHNDISMFETANFSVAMQNASQTVKKTASKINKYNNNEDGIAQFINEEIFNGTYNNQ